MPVSGEGCAGIRDLGAVRVHKDGVGGDHLYGFVLEKVDGGPEKAGGVGAGGAGKADILPLGLSQPQIVGPGDLSPLRRQIPGVGAAVAGRLHRFGQVGIDDDQLYLLSELLESLKTLQSQLHQFLLIHIQDRGENLSDYLLIHTLFLSLLDKL